VKTKQEEEEGGNEDVVEHNNITSGGGDETTFHENNTENHHDNDKTEAETEAEAEQGQEESRQSSNRTAVLIIAVNPSNDWRFKAFWSQLECFTPLDKIKKVIIATPGWTGFKGVFKPFAKYAIKTIPHLNESNIVIRTYMNNRHDVGLWCDALKDNQVDPLNDIPVSELYDDFILINDSLFALRQNYVGVLDVLQKEDINMTSLNYSFLHGENQNSFFPYQWVFGRSDRMWVESTFRAFNHEGMKTFMNHSCVPAYHPHFCPQARKKSHKKRCIVEAMEIRIASLYEEFQVKGLFPSDAPADISNEGSMWHSNFKMWEQLYRNQGFPVIKITSNILMNSVKERGMEKIFQTCTKLLDESYLEPIRRVQDS